MSVCTSAFEIAGAAMAKAYGRPDFTFATVSHPTASVSREVMRERVDALMPEILRILGVQA